jgi:hypothetical protein
VKQKLSWRRPRAELGCRAKRKIMYGLIHLTQDSDKFHALVNKVMEFGVLEDVENS